jgi:cell fate regulator YaaT (PSP1 superfamily)
MDDAANPQDEYSGGGALDGMDEGYAGDNDIVTGIEGRTLPPDTPVYQLRVACSNETIYAVYNGQELKPGTMVMVPTRYGRDLARISGRVCSRMLHSISKITRMDRIATELDLEKEKNNRPRENEALNICKQKIIERKLEMKLVFAHYLLDENKLLFFFTAENRVDFRELVKDLVAVFKVRIELRQIGIRDEARITGGLGTCGRSFCCYSISDKLKPVAIKMAKDQNLSLNSMKISGPCGRLLCCLAYEHGFYAEQRRLMPNEGTKLMFEGASWKITEINAVLGTITINAEDGRILRLPKNRFEKTDSRWTIKK